MRGMIYRKNRSIVSKTIKDGSLRELLEYMPPLQYMISVGKEGLETGNESYDVGFALPGEFSYPVPHTEEFFEIPSRICVTLLLKMEVRKIEEKWENLSLYEAFEKSGVWDFLRENHLTLKGDVTGFTYYDTIEPGLFTHYIQFYFPVF